MKNKVIPLILLALCVVGLSFLGSFIYHYVNEGKQSEEDKMLTDLKSSLALSENQICKMKECQGCFKDDCGSINVRFNEKKLNLIKALKEDNVNADNITALINEIDSLQSLLLRTTVRNILEQKCVLDESQRNKFFDILLTQVSNEQKTNKK
jgi:hypothetical protein